MALDVLQLTPHEEYLGDYANPAQAAKAILKHNRADHFATDFEVEYDDIPVTVRVKVRPDKAVEVRHFMHNYVAVPMDLGKDPFERLDNHRRLEVIGTQRMIDAFHAFGRHSFRTR